MKDYSNYIKNFFSHYKIENGELLVYTPNTKKNEPHRLPLTKENIKKFESKLEKQYQILIDNQDKIIEYEKNRKNFLLKVLLLILAPIPIMAVIIYDAFLIPLIIMASYLSVALIGSYMIKKSIDKFRKEIKQYIRYINNRLDIEKQSEIDKNVTTYLNQKTKNLIEENQTLKNQGTIDSVFNIDLMDKMSLKELKKLLQRYKLSKSIEEEQSFRLPKKTTYTRVLTPKKK